MDAVDDMMLVAKRLRESLKGDTNIQVIGIANQDLVIYTIKKPRADYPELFEGHKVMVRKIGRIAPLGKVL